MRPYRDWKQVRGADEQHHRPSQGVAQVSQVMSPENQETKDGEHVMNDESDFGKDLS
jgi:hypothetical protein